MCPGAKRLGPKVLQDLINDQFFFRCPILFVQWDARDSPRFKRDYFQMRDYFQNGTPVTLGPGLRSRL